MNDAVLVALISGVCTLVGTFGGIITSSKLTTYRLEQLEDKVNEHNQIIERTYRLEGRMDEAEHDIASLRDYHKPHSN